MIGVDWLKKKTELQRYQLGIRLGRARARASATAAAAGRFAAGTLLPELAGVLGLALLVRGVYLVCGAGAAHMVASLPFLVGYLLRTVNKLRHMSKETRER